MTGAPTSVPGSDPAAAGRPLDERLLDTRAPAEYALSPDGRTLIWALHATVDDDGRHFPADLWRSTIGRARRAADAPDRGSEPGMVAGRIADRLPVRPDHTRPSPSVRPAGERLGRGAPGGEPPGLRGERELVRRWPRAPRPGRGSRLLRARLVGPLRDRRRRGRAADPPTCRRVAAPVPRGRHDGRGGRGRAGGAERLGGRLGRRLHGRRPRLRGPQRQRLVPRPPRDARSRTAVGALDPRAPPHPRGRGAVAGRDARRRGRGLFERSRPAHRQRPRDRPRERPHRRPVARPADGRPGVMGR